MPTPMVRRCPACGAVGSTCGPAAPIGVPVDLPAPPRKGAIVGPLRKYRVTMNGHKTTARLNDADAAALGAVLVEPDEPTPTQPQTPKTPEPETDDDDDEGAVGTKGRRPPNKARQTRIKRDGR